MLTEKINSMENAPLSEIQKMIEKGHKMNKGKIAFRINNNIVIQVKPEQATEEYRQAYLKKIKFGVYIVKG